MDIKNKILLIWPWNPNHFRTHELFPIGLGHLANLISRDFFNLMILDCSLNDILPTSEQFKQALLDFHPDVVGISWWSNNTPIVETTIRSIKSTLPDALVCVGGPHATAIGHLLIKNDLIDFVFVGESEINFASLLKAISIYGGYPDESICKSIGGLIFKNSQGQYFSTEQSFVENLDNLGRIDYERLQLPAYHNQGYYYGGKLMKVNTEHSAPIVTSRGCPYNCTYCMGPILNGHKIRRNSIDHIIQTIEILYHDFGVKYLTIADDNFTFNPAWAEEVCLRIAHLSLSDLTIGTPNGVRMSRLTASLLYAMHSAGWKEITIAPESGSPRTLFAMRKKVDLGIVSKVVEMCHSADLKVSAFFIIGYPNETLEDIKLTEKFIYDVNFDFVGISIFQPLPGTVMFNKLVEDAIIPRGFIPGHYQEITFKHPFLSPEVLCDEYNRIWNDFRKFKGLPIKNRHVASIRAQDVVSTFI
ncbi:MAG: radical SAM protein [Smithella sp.]